MGRRTMLRGVGLVAGVTLLLSGCGGGGSGGGSIGQSSPPTATLPVTPRTPTPAQTPTPLRATSDRNEVTQANDAGSITLRVEKIVLVSGQSTLFSVLLFDAAGHPAANQHISFESAPGLIVDPPEGTTRADGTFNGSILGLFGGSVTAKTDADSSFKGLSATLTIIVVGGQIATPTPMDTTPTPTETVEPCTDVKTIIVQTDLLNVSSQAGGHPRITAVVFDSNNVRVGQVKVLFDVQPRIAEFDQLDKSTDNDGTVSTGLLIPPGSTFGTVIVTATACNITGSVPINIVSGVSPKPVASVVLQAVPSTVSNITGGTITLTAAVFDADNTAINGIDVLFITTIGSVNPLTDRTKTVGQQSGFASSTLDVPVAAAPTDYVISALAGGVQGKTVITVVPELVPPGGAVKPGVPPGEPAGITLSASPARIQVAGTGGTDLSTIVGRVIDNNGNPLKGARIHYHVVSQQSAPGASILPPTSPTPGGSPTPVPTTLCSPDDPVSVSDIAGFASIQVHAGPQPGPVTIAACADTTVFGAPTALIEQQALVNVTSGPVTRLTVTINSQFIDNNDGSLTTTASAVVADAQGNVVEDGTPVFFEVLARHVCSAGSNAGGGCSTNAECPGGVCIEDPTDSSRSVAISSNSTTNALPPCDVTQFVVQTGSPVTVQPGDAITCIKFPARQQGSEVVIRATVAGVTNNLAGQALTLPGSIADFEVSVSPPSIQVGANQDGLAIVRASTLDSNLEGVENVRVRFFTSVGSIDRSDLSDADGDATATLVIPAGTPSGNVTLRVAGGGLQIGTITIPIVNIGGGATPTPGGVDQPAGLRFVGASANTIGVRGSGLPEQSVLTFQVTNGRGDPVSGVTVNFSLAQIADESIAPAQDVSDADGNVQVTLTSGKRALSAQVTASVTSVSPALVTRSTAVNIVGGPPSQSNFSLAHQLANVSGGVRFGTENDFVAYVADRFGNPVPAGTIVNWTTKGGAIGDQLPTNTLGQAVATLVAQQPVPEHGTVNTLATTRGERPFVDVNGNGICDDADVLLSVPEPYYDSNCNGTRDPDEDFVDLNHDGVFNTNQGGAVSTCADPIVVFSSLCTTFSGPTAAVLLTTSNDPIPAGGTRDFTLIVSDNPDPLGNPGVGNPIVGGSTITISVDGGRAHVLGVSTFTIADAFTNDTLIDGINRFHFTVTDNSPTAPDTATNALIIRVSSEPGSLPGGGNGSVLLQVPLTFLGVPTPTPTVTPTFTATSTATPTPTITPTPTQTGTPTNTPFPRSIAFVNAQPATIGVHGSGLVEQSTLTFRVTDAQAQPISGIPVQFAVNALGGETVEPAQAITDTAGLVRTTLSSGDRPASVRVTATVVGNSAVTTQSTQVNIVNGLPAANRFHLSTEFQNIAGRVTLGLRDGITVFANDRFGNAVPAGTTVSFQSDGGSLVDLAPTNDEGQATAVLVSEGTVPANGVVTLLVFTRGEKAFTDLNGNGVPDAGEPVAPLPEPFFDTNGNGTRDGGESFIDVNHDGVWNADQNPVGGFSDQAVVFDTDRVTFSGPAVVTLTPSTFTIPDGGSQQFVLTIRDDLNNPLVGGTTVALALTSIVSFQGIPAFFTLPDVQTFGQLVEGVNQFTFTLTDSQPGMGDTAQPVSVSWTVASPISNTAPGGNGDRVALSSGTLLPVPPPTPTFTRTPTFTLTPTLSPTPFPSGQPTFTPTSTPPITPTAPVGSIAFVSALPATIGVRASGLPEQSVVTFQAKDTLAQPIVGAPVTFQLTGSGSEILNPTAGITDANGMVSTTVTSGFRATTVRITASADSNGDSVADIFVQSQVVGILGAPPAFNHFSAAAERLNIAGRVSFGITDTISAYVNDRFGNAVPPQTSVSFITNAASVVNPTVTNSSGVASVTLLSEGFVPPTGIVTVLAFTRGEESFFDNNGNGKFDCFPEAGPPCHSNIDSLGPNGEDDNIAEPRIDFRPLPSTLQPNPSLNDSTCVLPAPSSQCNAKFDVNKAFELFVDSDGNGLFDSPPANPTGNGFGQGVSGSWDNNIFVWSALPVTFSGPLVTPLASPTSFSIAPGGAQAFTLEVHDDLINPLVGGSQISVTAAVGTVSGGSITVPDGHSFNQLVDGMTRFGFVLSAGANTGPLVSTSIVVTVTSTNGTGTFVVATGLIPGPAAPTPTPTP